MLEEYCFPGFFPYIEGCPSIRYSDKAVMFKKVTGVLICSITSLTIIFFSVTTLLETSGSGRVASLQCPPEFHWPPLLNDCNLLNNWHEEFPIIIWRSVWFWGQTWNGKVLNFWRKLGSCGDRCVYQPMMPMSLKLFWKLSKRQGEDELDPLLGSNWSWYQAPNVTYENS